MSEVPPGFELLIRTLPKAFRDAHRDGMRDLMTRYANGRSAPGRAIMWVRMALDLVWVAAVLRIRGVTRRARTGSGVRSPTNGGPFDTTWQDIRYALRSLRRDPSLAIFATAIVGLGVGATATVFSVVDALLLRPLPFERAEELVWISNGEWGRGQQLSSISVQVAHLQDLRNESEQLIDVAGYHLFDRVGDHTLTGLGNPERLTRLRVTENFFQLLGVTPMHGRLFTAEEVQFSGPGAVLLQHGFWLRRFGGDPAIVGESISLNGTPTSVVGILPASFDFSEMFSPENPVDFVAPFPLSEETNRTGNTLALIGRLRPGATVEAVQTEARLIAARPRPDRRNSFTPAVVPLRDHVSGAFEPAVLLITGAVGFVMLIVCANLSNLLLARGTAREKEIAIRGALGASRPRLVRQLLTESLVLASCGAALGLVVAVGGTRLVTGMDINVPLLNQVRVDGTVLAFTLIVAVVTGIVFGVAPAVRVSALALHDALCESRGGSSHGRRQSWVRGGLVVVEVALACVLLISASLLLRSLFRVMDVDLGFEPQSAAVLRIDPGPRFASREQRVAYFDEALQRVRAVPGIEGAGTTDVLPTAFNRRWTVPCTDPNDRSDPEGVGCHVAYFVRVVSEGYVAAMGLDLVSGRDLSSSDDANAAPVILINGQFAERLWPGQDPMGRTLSTYRRDWTVVGVVRGMRHLTPEQVPGPEVFFTFRQMPDFGPMHLISRWSGPLSALTTTIRNALSGMQPEVPINEFRPIRSIIDRSLSSRRFVVSLLVAFAGFAVLLASLGIYGVISYTVNQRRREMGIRLALGATAATLHRRILGDTLTIAVVGLGIGLVAAWGLARSMQWLLFEVQALDPLTFAVAPTVLLLVSACAGYFPARRAGRLDPVTALRTDQ